MVEILGAVREARAHATTVMAEIFRKERVPAQRRGVLAEQVYAILRSERLLDFALDAATKTPLTGRGREKARRLAHAVLTGTLAPGEAEREFRRVDWNEVLNSRRRVAKESDPVKRLAISESLPDWLAERMLAQLGSDAVPLAHALGEPAPQTIRANRVRIERAALAERLREHGIATEETQLASDGLRLVTRTNLFQLAEFREGLFEVQDEGSQLVSELVAPPPGGSVLDACAGTGGKTLHLGALLRGKGSITAVGVGESALGQIAELRRRADRAGLNNVRMVLLPDARVDVIADSYGDELPPDHFLGGLPPGGAQPGMAPELPPGAPASEVPGVPSGAPPNEVPGVPPGEPLGVPPDGPVANRTASSQGGLPPPLLKLVGRVDRVLVDAPCSGVGVLRRNPEARSRIEAESIERLSALQRSILERFAPFVKVGGRLIYSTCSFLREENEEVVESFLAAHPDFVRMPAKEILGAKRALAMGDGDVLRVFPHRHGTDAFWGAVLRRVSPQDGAIP